MVVVHLAWVRAKYRLTATLFGMSVKLSKERMMTTILGVAEAALYVDNLGRAIQFYEEVLGLRKTAVFDDTCFLQTGSASTIILFDRSKLAQRVSVIPSHGSVGQGHVALAIPPEEMDAWRQRLLAHGVAIEHEQDWSQGTHSIYFRDPDNNSLELIDGRHYGWVGETAV
jgi:catechol 2,3-dioxygenase-like lactoylglutathione lyase family enzyme